MQAAVMHGCHCKCVTKWPCLRDKEADNVCTPDHVSHDREAEVQVPKRKRPLQLMDIYLAGVVRIHHVKELHG